MAALGIETVAEFMVVVPSAPETAEPIFMFVVDPETPDPPTFTVFVVAFVVAPLDMFIVAAPVDAPMLKVVAAEPKFIVVDVALKSVKDAAAETIVGFLIVAVPVVAPIDIAVAA